MSGFEWVVVDEGGYVVGRFRADAGGFARRFVEEWPTGFRLYRAVRTSCGVVGPEQVDS
jgi:hypothetical protein